MLSAGKTLAGYDSSTFKMENGKGDLRSEVGREQKYKQKRLKARDKQARSEWKQRYVALDLEK